MTSALRKSLPLPQSPSGIKGRLFAWLMERMNAAAYARAIDALKPTDSERFLEIGFGSGRFVELLIEAAPRSLIAGVDPTQTMVSVARNRRRISGAASQVDLREGSDAALSWPKESFDAVIAIHNFQFWSNPSHSLMEIRRVLKPGGRIVIVFRDHSLHAPAWLANPISRSGSEVEGAIALLVAEGFHSVEWPPAGSSRVLLATLGSKA
jgi:ubiquinone/menaquinone biosynthesis C-methylase UbiE